MRDQKKIDALKMKIGVDKLSLAAYEERLVELEAESEYWEPKEYRRYFTMTSRGHVISDTHDNMETDFGRIDIGNFFKTEEEAKDRIQLLRVLANGKKSCAGFVPDWGDDDQVKYRVTLDVLLNTWVAACYQYEGALLYFPTREVAQTFLDNMSDDDKRIYFRGFN